MYLQIEQNKRSKGIVHKYLIYSKIDNQKNILKTLNKNDYVINALEKLSKNILQGDTTNREAVATRIYFRELYGSYFVRFKDELINSQLNFGYKILVSYITKNFN